MARDTQRRPSLVEVRQTINFTMDYELFSRVAAYHNAVRPGGLAAETYRELLWTAISQNPTQGVLIAARIIGVNKARAFVLSEAHTALNQLAQRLALMAQEADANTLAEAQLAVQNAVRALGGNGNGNGENF